MEASDNAKHMTYNMAIKQPSSISKRSAQVDLLPRNSSIPIAFGSQQLLPLEAMNFSQATVQAPAAVGRGSYLSPFASKKSVDMALPAKDQISMPAYLGLKHFQPSNELIPLMEPLSAIQNRNSITYVAPLSSRPGKQLERMESLPKFQTTMPMIARSLQLSSTNKRPSPAEQPSKVQAEFESIRKKLRESLSLALAISYKEQSKEKNIEKNAVTIENSSKKVESSQQNVNFPTATDGSVCESLSNIPTSNSQVNESDRQHGLPSEMTLEKNMDDKNQDSDTCVVQEVEQKNIVPVDDVPPNDHSIVEDELLHGHGLCWASDLVPENVDAVLNSETKRPKLMNAEESSTTKDTPLQIPQSLAVQIEMELFKLFGGVNKKYKEKGRSLLFNLKDPSNPELRERVLSGDLPPRRLCSMTAEELASKELSQWRQAKAEELAQMVVLPDMDIDIRRVVKKTHKGEFQVELEQDDGAHVEVGLGSDVLLKKPLEANKESQIQPRSKGKGKVLSKGLNTSAGFVPGEKSDMDRRNLSSSLDPILPDKADYMQDLMEEDLKESELLPPVVSLDEFMQALDSEPPFENLDVNASQSNLSPNERSLISPHSANRHTLDNPGHRTDSASNKSRTRLASESTLNSRLRVSDIHDEDGKGNSELSNSKADEYREGDDELKYDSSDVKQVPTGLDASAKCNKMWEGVLQLNASSLSSVVSFFLSGEKTSMQEWPNMLEVKGRVRLDAFEKFVQALPLSRSRAIMVLEVSWKEGSVDSGRLHLAEAINSYITDERLGFAEPAPGVELYLCPSHPKLTGMLEKHLPKDQIESISSIVNGLIGIVVWRRPNVINSPRVHGKHSSSKKHTSSRKHRLSIAPNTPKPQPEDDDDVPPGFGPPISREDDDLPEFDFTHGGSKARHHSQKLGRPADHMRELVLKYGQGGGQDQSLGITVQPWNDDDDIPEWQPNNDRKPPPQPIDPPPPLPSQLQAYPQQQQTVQPFVVNQQLISPQQQQHMLQPNSSQFLQLPPVQPQVGGLQSMPLQNVPSQPGVAWWPAPRGHQDGGVQFGGLLQPCHVGGQPNVQFQGVMPAVVHGFGGLHNGHGVAWRPDGSGNRGI